MDMVKQIALFNENAKVSCWSFDSLGENFVEHLTCCLMLDNIKLFNKTVIILLQYSIGKWHLGHNGPYHPINRGR